MSAEGPIRTCVGCRRRVSQQDLVRLVWDGSALIVSRVAPGRGAWVHLTQTCVGSLRRKGVLSRAFRVTVPVDAVGVVERLL